MTCFALQLSSFVYYLIAALIFASPLVSLFFGFVSIGFWCGPKSLVHCIAFSLTQCVSSYFFPDANVFTQMNSLDLFSFYLAFRSGNGCTVPSSRKCMGKKLRHGSNAKAYITLNKYLTCNDGKLASVTKWDFFYCSCWVSAHSLCFTSAALEKRVNNNGKFNGFDEQEKGQWRQRGGAL